MILHRKFCHYYPKKCQVWQYVYISIETYTKNRKLNLNKKESIIDQSSYASLKTNFQSCISKSIGSPLKSVNFCVKNGNFDSVFNSILVGKNNFVYHIH